MMSHRLICLLVLLFVIGCKDRTRNEYDDTVIDREKIDKVFGHDVSQVLFPTLD